MSEAGPLMAGKKGEAATGQLLGTGTLPTVKKQTVEVTGISKVFLFKFIDCKSLFFFFFFSLFLLFKKKNGKKNTLFKKKKMSLDSYTEKKKLDSALPARRPQTAGLEGEPGATRGQGHSPGPPRVLGRTPICSPSPPPPTLGLLILESEGKEECGKYLKAAAGAREVAGGRVGGSRGRVIPRDRVEMPPPPPPGVQASRAPPSSGRGIWSRWS